MKYDLCEFSLRELRILSKLVDKEISAVNLFTRQLLEIMPENSDTRNEILEHNNRDLPELREMNVRILTALDIVKNREKVQSN